MHDDRAKEGVVHLQAAALELIAAGRAFLDVAEELVREPGALAAFVDLARSMAAQPPPSTSPSSPDRSEASADAADKGDGPERVTRIRVT